jgi:hypothetical protein
MDGPDTNDSGCLLALRCMCRQNSTYYFISDTIVRELLQTRHFCLAWQ